MKNWKTTTIGVLTIAATVVGAGLSFLKTGTIPDPTTTLAAIGAGWGLIVAGDAPAAK